MRAKSLKQRCPALCILWLELLCSCRIGGWSGHLTASGSRYDFPGVDPEGRQTCRLPITFIVKKILYSTTWHSQIILFRRFAELFFLSASSDWFCVFSDSSSLVFSFVDGNGWWWWWWEPLTWRTNFSTARNVTIPASTHKPTIVVSEWSWPWEWSCECSWTWWWPWSWESSPWVWGCKAWGIRCKNASPKRPPDAKLNNTFKSGWYASELLSIGTKNKIAKGAALINKVEKIACHHKSTVCENVRTFLYGLFTWECEWLWVCLWAWSSSSSSAGVCLNHFSLPFLISSSECSWEWLQTPTQNKARTKSRLIAHHLDWSIMSNSIVAKYTIKLSSK